MSRKILLVDDDPAVRRMLLRLLDEENYSVRPTGTGREALDLAASETFHLLLLDGDLPGENGADICRQFARAHPAVPIIILRSGSNGSAPEPSTGAGVCLEKPLDMEKLLRSISELLGADHCQSRIEPAQRPQNSSPAATTRPAWDLSWSSIT